MATNQMSEIIQQFRKAALLRDGAGLTDGQLLEEYISRRDEAAFAALVRRHGPMVWGVCRRVLHNHHDAEDAFQASFLVLVRKAALIVPRARVANWLYGVAHQTALKVRATAAARKWRERQMAKMPEAAVSDQELWRDLQPLLDEELSRLPHKYRAVVVLCDLEGKTRKDAARQLDCPEGTVAGRLARARTMLAKRLARRGLAVWGGALAAMLSQRAASAFVPTSVMSSTINAASVFGSGQAAATGAISVKVGALTEGVLKSMFFTKLKIVMVVLVLTALTASAALIYPTRAADLPTAQTATENADMHKRPVSVKKDEKPKPDKDRLQGTWKIVSNVDDGNEQTGSREEVGNWTVKDTTIRVTTQPKDMKAGTTIEWFRFKLDETTKPRSIDLVEWAREFNDGDECSQGVYSITGDTLRVCVSLKKGKRPKAIESTKGSSCILWTLKRESAKDKDKKDDKSDKP
jgi:RNA polymerase sigma factor (sigma-70 family)